MNFVFDPSLVLFLPLYELDGNSFMSKDACGHLCAVTGALWRPQGRYFDGIDDRINGGAGNSLDISGDVTVIVWGYFTDLSSQSGIVTTGNNITSSAEQYALWVLSSKIAFVNGDGSSGEIKYMSPAPPENQWICIAFTRIASTVQMFANGVTAGSAALTKTPTSLTRLTIGALRQTATTYTLYGSIGEVYIYNRALTPQEIQHNYLATKWRYQ